MREGTKVFPTILTNVTRRVDPFAQGWPRYSEGLLL